MNSTRLSIIPFLSVLSLACSKGERTEYDTVSSAVAPAPSDTTSSRSQTMALQVTSGAFAQSALIPARYTCEGDDVSPPLSWSGSPAGTKSFALIMEDPDAPDPAKPRRIWVHWVVYNLPASATTLSENASRRGLPAGAAQGKGDSGKSNYGGPCPPIGRHRYFFKLYALDTELTGLSTPAKSDLLKAIEGHVLARGDLIGTYQKSGRAK